MSKKGANDRQQKSYTKCPHCGKSLSPWEQVLLSVDRVLTCRHCWYRILMDIKPDESRNQKEGEDKGTKG